MSLPPCSHSSGQFWPFSLRLETPATGATLVFWISEQKQQRPVWRNSGNRRLACSESTRDLHCNTCPRLDRRGPPFWWRTVRTHTLCSQSTHLWCGWPSFMFPLSWTQLRGLNFIICRTPCQYCKHRGGCGYSGASLSLLSVLELLFSVQDN